MALTSQLSLSVGAKQTSALDLGTAEANIAKTYAVSLVNGTLAGQADRLWSDTRTIAASGNDDLDLAGVLLDAFGQAITFARVKALVVAAWAANTNNVVVGNAATNGWSAIFGAATHTLVLRPGAVQAVMAGPADLTAYTVTGGTGDTLRITNGAAGSTVTYDIAVIGCSV